MLEKLAFGEPVLARLAILPRLVAEKNFETVNRAVVLLRRPLGRFDPRLAERLTQILIGSVLHEASELDLDDAERMLKSFTRVAEPMAIDPNWNRFWALATDLTEVDRETVRDYWLQYIRDLETIPAFSPAERVLAQAMVWNRVAVLYCDDAEELESPDSTFDALSRMLADAWDKSELNELKQQAVQSLERSLALAPLHLPTYRLQIEIQKSWKNKAGVEAAAQRLLEKFPDDVETLRLLLDSAIARDQPEEAMACAGRIRALKPLDLAIREREAVIRIGLRAAMRAGRPLGRGARPLPGCGGAVAGDWRLNPLLGRQGRFRSEGGRRDESERLLKEAQASLPEPAPVWLAVAIASRRYQLSVATTNGYVELWTSELRKKCQSQTAGEMAGLLTGCLQRNHDYPGRGIQLEQLVGYLKRATRVKFRQMDIERVCRFLAYMPKHKARSSINSQQRGSSSTPAQLN